MQSLLMYRLHLHFFFYLCSLLRLVSVVPGLCATLMAQPLYPSAFGFP